MEFILHVADTYVRMYCSTERRAVTGSCYGNTLTLTKKSYVKQQHQLFLWIHSEYTVRFNDHLLNMAYGNNGIFCYSKIPCFIDVYFRQPNLRLGAGCTASHNPTAWHGCVAMKCTEVESSEYGRGTYSRSTNSGLEGPFFVKYLSSLTLACSHLDPAKGTSWDSV